jgi:hypothetical protein
MNILVVNFNAEVGREDNFKLKSETRVHTKLLMTVELEQYTLLHLKT